MAQSKNDDTSMENKSEENKQQQFRDLRKFKNYSSNQQTENPIRLNKGEKPKTVNQN